MLKVTAAYQDLKPSNPKPMFLYSTTMPCLNVDNISENSPDLLDLLTFASGSSYIDMYLFGLLEFYLFYILCISVKNQQQKLPTEQVIPKDIW